MKNEPKFNGSQDVLYEVCISLWNLCEENLPAFNAIFSHYDATYIQQHRQAVLAAKEIGTPQNRDAERQAALANYEIKAPLFLNLYDQLTSFIRHAYPAPEAKANIQATVGLATLSKARNASWKHLLGLINASETFLNENMNYLFANSSMSTAFVADFLASAEMLKDYQDTAAGGQNTAKRTTTAKRAANSAIYGAIQTLKLDAEAVFRVGNPIREEFTVERHKKRFTLNRPAGIFARVINKTANKYLKDATITLDNLSGTKSGTTDKLGICRISPLASDKYLLTCSADGFITQTFPDFFIPKGKRRQIKINLEQAPPATV